MHADRLHSVRTSSRDYSMVLSEQNARCGRPLTAWCRVPSPPSTKKCRKVEEMSGFQAKTNGFSMKINGFPKEFKQISIFSVFFDQVTIKLISSTWRARRPPTFGPDELGGLFHGTIRTERALRAPDRLVPRPVAALEKNAEKWRK